MTSQLFRHGRIGQTKVNQQELFQAFRMAVKQVYGPKTKLHLKVFSGYSCYNSAYVEVGVDDIEGIKAIAQEFYGQAFSYCHFGNEVYPTLVGLKGYI